MHFEKAQWDVSQEKVQAYLPITKIDRENRTVSGFATLDNIDGHGDVVRPEASRKAFTRWQGNLREMHQPKAVGTAVKFEEREYFDPKTEQVYKGMYVTVRVSKGAEDTWQKVLDGTLKGFSVGGKILKKSEAFHKSTGDLVRFVDDYDMQELSLVDVPANPLATILAIHKSADGQVTAEGIALLKGENILYCKPDDLMLFTEDDKRNCDECGKEMRTIGWAENGSDKVELAKSLIAQEEGLTTDDLLHKSNTGTLVETKLHAGEHILTRDDVRKYAEEIYNELNKGGASVAEETAEVQETVEPVETPAADEVLEKAEAAEVDEVTPQPLVDEDALVKTLTAQVSAVVTDALGGVQEALANANTEATAKYDELTKQLSDLSTELATVKGEVSTLGERVEIVTNDTAIRKSQDLGEEPEEKLEKSLWSGRFLGAVDLTS